MHVFLKYVQSPGVFMLYLTDFCFFKTWFKFFNSFVNILVIFNMAFNTWQIWTPFGSVKLYLLKEKLKKNKLDPLNK